MCSPGEQVDLDKRTIKTLAGNGTKAEQDYVGGQRGAAQLLNSPWDLAFDAQVGCLTRVQNSRPASGSCRGAAASSSAAYIGVTVPMPAPSVRTETPCDDIG